MVKDNKISEGTMFCPHADNDMNHGDNREFETRTKRVVSNSLLLFMRMLFVTVINLYAVRLVLRGLGVVDYGIYYAVSGIVLTSSFVILVLSTSLQRFYSFAFGKNDRQLIDQLFASSINIIILLSVIILLLLETVGLWYINNELSYPAERADVVFWVYQFAILSFVFTLLLVPFTAPLFSHEDMGIYALLSCVDYGLRFVIALLIASTPIDKLVFYASALFLVSFIMFVLYATITMKKYPECKYRVVKDKNIYKSLLTFSGWTMYGALAGTGMIQGSILILNFFFGPLANAAFAIANQVYNAFSSLSNSIVLSFRPAMIKAYAEGKTDYLNSLFSLNNKVLLYVTACVAIPMVFEMDFILQLWLGDDLTTDMVVFSRFFVVYIMFVVMHNPITTIIQSTGNIKKYQLIVQTITLFSLPLAIILFIFNFPSYYIFVSIIICCVIAHIFRIYCLKEQYPFFSTIDYLKKILIPGLFILVLTSIYSWMFYIIVSNEIVRFFVIIITSPCLLLILAYFLGVTSLERQSVNQYVKRFLKHRWHILSF